jgi:V-type H+-transporting ATPase subunit a
MGIDVVPAGTVESFVEKSLEGEVSSGAYVLEKLEADLDKSEQQLVELNRYNKKLSEEFVQKVEYHHLLVKAKKFLHAHSEVALRDYAEDNAEVGIALSPLLNETVERGGNTSVDEMSFSNIAGVLPIAERVRFERMLFRATRGNCYVRFSPLPRSAVDARGETIAKICFIIFYKSQSIEGKIKKICDAFAANRYELRDLNNAQRMGVQLQENQRELNDAKVVLDKNNQARRRICVELADTVESWLWIVRREKGIYHTLNLFKNDVAGNLLRGRGWILTDKVKSARNAIKRSYMSLNLQPSALMEKVPESWPAAPTHFETNKFTYAFQEFVNTYGVPRYKEINPALFTAATFPFLFGVMYGDIGHGSCLALTGLLLILTEKVATLRSTPDSTKEFYSARYMLFGMGIMAIYCGLIYNDYFSIGLDLFGSRWIYVDQNTGDKARNIGEYGDSALVYPFGVDPAWKISGNELLFYNSMKMKMSVILGIFQMTFGVILRGLNSVYFNSRLDFFAEFMPMIIFAVSLFGYMVILIFVKWSVDWNQRMALGTCGYDANGVYGACSLSTSSSCYTYGGRTPCNANTLLMDMCPLNYGMF